MFDAHTKPEPLKRWLGVHGGKTIRRYTVRSASREARDAVPEFPMERGVGVAYHKLDQLVALTPVLPRSA